MTDFWKTIDLAVSALSAESGGDSVGLISWCLARDFGSNEYSLRLRQKNEFIELPDSPVHPVCRWLAKHGLYPYHMLRDRAMAEVEAKLEDGDWNSVLDTDNKMVRSSWRRPSLLMWRDDPHLSHFYWKGVIEGRGMPEHRWIRELHEDLSSPINPQSRRRALGHLGRLMAYFPEWENESGFSLRHWASGSEEWQDILDQSGVGYQAKVGGVPLIAMAVGPEGGPSPGWHKIVSKLSDSCLLEATLQPEDRPSHWWDEFKLGAAPMAPLWCWAARVSDAKTIESLLRARPELAHVSDSMNRNALHWAATVGNSEVVDVLLRHGVNPAQEDLYGLLPEETVSPNNDELYEKVANARLGKPRPAV